MHRRFPLNKDTWSPARTLEGASTLFLAALLCRRFSPFPPAAGEGWVEVGRKGSLSPITETRRSTSKSGRWEPESGGGQVWYSLLQWAACRSLNIPSLCWLNLKILVYSFLPASCDIVSRQAVPRGAELRDTCTT